MVKSSYIQAYRTKRIHHAIGLMSGTSLDGVDGVLLEIVSDDEANVRSVNVLKRATIGYSAEMRQRMEALCTPGGSDTVEFNAAHIAVAHWYAHVVKELVQNSKVNVDVIGMHGQTIWHEPNGVMYPLPDGPGLVRGTFQLGNPLVLSYLTNIPVVSDFRNIDIAAGGQGAPLAPYIDHLLFAIEGKGVAVQNIGGIGNVTVLPAHGGKNGIIAFDTGPGNMIIDAVVQWGTNGTARYDNNGAIAAKGTVDEEWLTQLMKDPYFAKNPPKSTGREVYGRVFVEGFVAEGQRRGRSFEDMVATATALTARSISSAYKAFVLSHTPLYRTVISGGGARNATLMKMIASEVDGEVLSSTDLGVLDIDREAMAFALMAHASMMGESSNLPAVTGAKHPLVLGTVTMEQL